MKVQQAPAFSPFFDKRPREAEDNAEEVLVEQFTKSKKSKNTEPKLRALIWDRYIGKSVKRTKCPLCLENDIAENVIHGFEACHVVAATFDDNNDSSLYSRYPGCDKCNSKCKTQSLFDFLFCHGRIVQLRSLIRKIYTTFIEEFQDMLSSEDRQIWKVLDHLYGPQKYKAGGGIQNRRQIYEIARTEQLRLLSEKMADLSAQVQAVAKEMEVVSSATIVTKIL